MPQWKPTGYPSMSPYLICNDAEALIDFTAKVFGSTLLRRFDRPDGSLMHAEVRIDDSVLMIGGAAPGFEPTSPHIHLYLADAEDVFNRAIAEGAEVVQPMARKEKDDLRGGFRDPSGTNWWVATQ